MPTLYYFEREGAYQVAHEWWTQTDICDQAAIIPHARLSGSGLLYVFPGYLWDGPSGPGIDTEDFMRASLAHDVLYEMIRRRKLHPSARKQADKELVKLAKEDGMPWWRRLYAYAALRVFGGSSAEPGDLSEDEVHSAGGK